MKFKIFLSIEIIIILIIISGCEKKEINDPPGLHFLQPDTNLIIDKDTIISFVVEPYDTDGEVVRVDFSINDHFYKSVFSSPYFFDWDVKTEENIGKNYITAIAFDNKGEKAEETITIEVKSFLSKWIGTYIGTSHWWTSYPTLINDQWEFINKESFDNISVDVSTGIEDSSLNIQINYDNSKVTKLTNLHFSNSGNHHTYGGIGSDFWSLAIHFESDSMYYYNYQKCGIPCVSEMSFKIKKQTKE